MTTFGAKKHFLHKQQQNNENNFIGTIQLLGILGVIGSFLATFWAVISFLIYLAKDNIPFDFWSIYTFIICIVTTLVSSFIVIVFSGD